MAICLHGFQAEECLICRTLEPRRGLDGPGPAGEATGRRRPATRTAGRWGAGRPEPSAGPVVVDDRPRGATTRHLAVAAVAVLAAIVVLWLVAGAVFALLRVVELVAVAALTGVVGYRLGRARGRRGH